MRTEKSLKNMRYSFIGQVINYFISFIVRTFFVYTLGQEYLGIMGLFTNILSVLSLAELGIGNAIVFSLYKPMAENDKDMIAKIMNFYAKAYKIISLIVLMLGLSLLPFLDNFINGVNDIDNLYLIYLLFLFDSSFTYLLSHRKLLFFADQKNYINIKITYIYTIILNLLQIIVLYFFHNFIYFLILKIIFNIAQNYTIYGLVGKKYPYIKSFKSSLNKKEEKKIWENVKYVCIYRIGGMVISSTDNIVISIFLSTNLVGVYSNYILIISAVNGMITQLFSSIAASVGNLNVVENEDKKFEIYKVMSFMSFWIYTFCGVALFCLLNPFIKLWLGNVYLLNEKELLLIILNFYFYGMMKNISEIFINAMGFFKYIKSYPLIGAIINIMVSIILVNVLGLIGVFIGTLVCYFCIYFWVWPFIVFKYGFKKNLFIYFKLFFQYLLYSFLIFVVTNFFVKCIEGSSLLIFFGKLILCLIIPNILICIFNQKSKEFNFLVLFIKEHFLIKRIFKN